MNDDSPRYRLLFGSLLAAALFSALVLSILAGCDMSSTEGVRSVVLGEIVELDEGDTVRLGISGALLTFHEVREDSRCPTGAVCIWQGRALAAFHLISAAGDTSFTLKIDGLVETPHEENQIVVIGAFQFRLLELNPYPAVSDDEPAARYTALLRVETSDSAQ